jgi:DNA-binding Lrp family transcriptional regulator
MTTARDDIKSFLTSNGRSTVNDIANGTGYTNGWIRQQAKELQDEGKIEGEQTQMAPAAIINGDYEVVTSSKQQLLAIIKKHKPSMHSRAKGMSVDRLQEYIRGTLADRIVGGPDRWEFWA